MRNIYITEKAHLYIVDTIGSFSPETGAILGASIEKPLIISSVWFDEPASKERNYYKPTLEVVEKIINEWASYAIRFVGIVHSHPDRFKEFSLLDKKSACEILRVNNMPYIIMGLYCEKILQFDYVYTDNGKCIWEKMKIIIV